MIFHTKNPILKEEKNLFLGGEGVGGGAARVCEFFYKNPNLK